MDFVLLREKVWDLEDKMNIVQESIADQEAELVRLKRLTNLISERVRRLESRTSEAAGRTNYD